MNEYDFLAKIVILGEPHIGKTTLWCKYCEGVFIPGNRITPGKSHKFCSFLNLLGVDFRIKTIEADGRKAKMQIWDTSNQEKFGDMPQFYYQGVDGVILCYGTNNRKSFERVEHWMGEMRKYASNDICTVLVGTKSDLSDERVVSTEEARKLAESEGIKFFETSAKENLKIDQAFLELAKDINVVLSKKKNDTQVTRTRLRTTEEKPKKENNCFNCS